MLNDHSCCSTGGESSGLGFSQLPREIGIEHVSLAGTPDVDSYNSVTASYNAQIPGDNGDLCSDGWIDVDGTTYVRGDANPGPGEETTVNNNSTVTGNTNPRLRSLDLPTVDTLLLLRRLPTILAKTLKSSQQEDDTQNPLTHRDTQIVPG